MGCTVRSCDAAVKYQSAFWIVKYYVVIVFDSLEGPSVTERFLSKTLDRINDLRSCDAHQTIETCIR